MAIITDVFSLQQRGRVMGFVQMAMGSQILGADRNVLAINGAGILPFLWWPD
jgi:hypothetical protein